MQTQQISRSEFLSTVSGWAWTGQAHSYGSMNWVMSPNLFKVSNWGQQVLGST